MSINTSKFPFTNYTYEEYLKALHDKNEIKDYFNIGAHLPAWRYYHTNQCLIKEFLEEHSTQNIIDDRVMNLMVNILGVFIPTCIEECVIDFGAMIYENVIESDEVYNHKYIDDDLSGLFNIELDKMWVIIDKNNNISINGYCERNGYCDTNFENLFPTKYLHSNFIAHDNHVYDSVHSIRMTEKIIKKYKLFDYNTLRINNVDDLLLNCRREFHLFNIKNCFNSKIIFNSADENELSGKIKKIYLNAQKCVNLTALNVIRKMDYSQYTKLINALSINYDKNINFSNKELSGVLSELGLSKYGFLIGLK